MANETLQQQPEPEKPKFSLFKPSEWPEFIRNWWIKLPGIRRAGFRRRKVGERFPPLLYEIRERWIKINRDMYSVLEKIEGIWGAQGQLMGFPPKRVKGDILYNKAGIVQTYVDFGVYSDIDRIPAEANWFDVGTDHVEEELQFEIPDRSKWDEYGWDSTAVERLLQSPSKPWRLTKVHQVKLGTGVVYHEGKIDQKEELHCFGFNKATALAAHILQVGSVIVHENFLQRTQVPVAIRGHFEDAVKLVQELLHKISEIEKTYAINLSKLQAAAQRHTQLWDDLVNNNTPESKDIIIRFPHTFRVLKPYLLEEITETVKKVDENGEIKEKTIKTYHSLYLDPDKNPYKKELEEVNKKIEDLGGELIVPALENELKKCNAQISKIEPVIKKERSDVVNKFKQPLLKYLSDVLALKKLKITDKQDILKRVEKSLDDLANSATEEFDEKKTGLFLLLESLLKNIGIKEDNIKKIIDTPKKILDDAIDKEGIRKLNEQLLQVSVNLIDIKFKRKQILELLFKKEQLEFYVKKLTPDNPEFKKRNKEFEYGLDENGYPLEIDTTGKITGTLGTVLIDCWWNEIAQNPWQLETIALKPGGKEVLEKHLEATVTYVEEEDKVTKEKKLRARVTGAKRPIRYVKDERFWGFLDLLEAGHIIFSYWDAVRDDFRDGRYHWHSKSVADYVIEGMGGFNEELAAPYFKGWGPSRKLGVFFTRRGFIPTGDMPIELNVADRKMQINANPYWFTNEKPPTGIPEKPAEISNVPNEEEKVKRDYIMKLTKVPEGDLPKYIIKKDDGYYIKGTRVPTKYNPAFDRRAEKMKYIHWGNMYYYRWSCSANEWSENPFPHKCTRGIALYMAYLAANDAYHYQDGIEVLRGQKMDYGVRGQSEHGVVNPLEGIGILQEN